MSITSITIGIIVLVIFLILYLPKLKLVKILLYKITNKIFYKFNIVEKYKIIDNENYSDYCKNLTNDKWDEFYNKCKNIFNEYKFSSKYCFEEFDIEQKFNEAIEFYHKNNKPHPFIGSIKGNTLKGIIISIRQNLPAKGVAKVEYFKEQCGNLSLYVINPAELYFFHSATGGLSITIRQQQCENLMLNKPQTIFFNFFRRLDDVTEYDIYTALKFFLECDTQNSLWGKPNLLWKIKFWWIIYRSKSFPNIVKDILKLFK